MSQDSETVRVYDAKAENYAELVHSEEDDLRLQDFIDRLPENGHVLDLGCGPGAHSAQMKRAGLTVLSTDASAEMAAVAKRKFGVDVTVGTFDDITHTNVFDGIWASFCLLHAPRTEMPRHLKSLQNAIKPGGIFYIGLKTGTGEQRDTIGRQYTYYSENEINGLLQDTGFTVLDTQIGQDVGLDGVVAPWIALVCRA